MPLPITQMVGGNLKDIALQGKIAKFFNNYIDTFQKKLVDRKLPRGMFSFGKPTNYFFFIDRKNFHCIYSSQYAGGLAEVIYVDLRDQVNESFSLEELASFLRAQKGITEWDGLTFDIALLDASDEEQNRIIESKSTELISKEYQALIRKHQPIFIPKQQLEKFLDTANEDELTNILLVPLLRHIGFQTAEAKGHQDRTLEFGQDIQRMKMQLPTGHWLYYSAQVKRGDIKGNTSVQLDYVEKVLTQTYAQLNWEMPDPEIGINVKPDHVLLIVSGKITEAAKQYIYKHSLVKDRRVLLLERDQILRLCEEKGLPETVQNTILQFNAPHTT
jgi:hypothetical protein